jgi:hypothetical protein
MKKKINEQFNENADFVRLISILLHSRTQVHTFHLQTNSYAEHMALNGYYTGIGDLIDGLVESYQGKYDILTGYKSYVIVNYESPQNTVSFFKSVCNKIDELRGSCDDSYIQNQIDTVQELLNSTLYKLRFLS